MTKQVRRRSYQLWRSGQQFDANYKEVRTRKMRTSFNWQIGFKLMVILLGIGINVALGNLLWHFHSNPVFAVAAGLIILFTSYCIVGYFLQLLLMLSINLSKNILATQRQLAQLEAVIVWTLRVSFLQAPVWPFLFVPRVFPAGVAPLYWVIEGTVVLLLLLVVVWMYRRITVAGASRGWVKKMVDNEGGKSIARARAFIKEIEEYKNEDEAPATAIDHTYREGKGTDGKKQDPLL